MAEEIELKLALPDGAHRRLLQSPVLQEAISRHSGRLVNIYYDTPTLDLHDKAIALRLRRQGKIWLQTVKCATPSAGGFSSRPEWEVLYGGHFDFSVIDVHTVRAWLDRDKIRRRIAPVFETNFLRTTWRIQPTPDTTLLVMLDRGWIVAAGRRESISEVEIELVSGDAGELFVLARRLAERVLLMPASRSKAERGYRLFLGQQAGPARAEPVALTSALTPQEAFRHITVSCLRQMESNHAGAIASSDPEYIHQMRVGVRRLRACLRLFAPCLPPGTTEELLAPLRTLMSHLGHARDLDVLQAEITTPPSTALPDEPRLAALNGLITDRRHRARRSAIQALLTPAYGQLLLRIAVLLNRLAGAAPMAAGVVALPEFAGQRLRKLRRTVRMLAKAARPDDAGSLHALRIASKRLRYALEFLAPLAPDKTWHQATRQLAVTQDILGQLNDLTNAGRLLAECAGEDMRLREAISLVGNWHRPRHANLSLQLPQLIRRLRRLPITTRA